MDTATARASVFGANTMADDFSGPSRAISGPTDSSRRRPRTVRRWCPAQPASIRPLRATAGSLDPTLGPPVCRTRLPGPDARPAVRALAPSSPARAPRARTRNRPGLIIFPFWPHGPHDQCRRRRRSRERVQPPPLRTARSQGGGGATSRSPEAWKRSLPNSVAAQTHVLRRRALTTRSTKRSASTRRRPSSPTPRSSAWLFGRVHHVDDNGRFRSLAAFPPASGRSREA